MAMRKNAFGKNLCFAVPILHEIDSKVKHCMDTSGQTREITQIHQLKPLLPLACLKSIFSMMARGKSLEWNCSVDEQTLVIGWKMKLGIMNSTLWPFSCLEAKCQMDDFMWLLYWEDSFYFSINRLKWMNDFHVGKLKKGLPSSRF